MQIRKSKTLSPAERIAKANERTGTALFVFEQAAIELDGASSDFEEIEADLLAQADAARLRAEALDAQAYVAFERRVQATEQADTIRGLIGTTTSNAA